MIGFFYNNEALLITIGAIALCVVLYFLVKALPTKASKKEVKQVVEPKKDEQAEKPVEPEVLEKPVEPETLEEPQDKTDKKQDKKPKIVQIYKRETKSESGETSKKDDPIYDRNVEFINTSKNIAKFKTFVDEESKQEDHECETDEFGFVQDKHDDCEFCETNTKHFDHSKRLSNYINDENADDMFNSHISEHYMNINSDRHLNLDEKFHKSLFSRADEMMNNSEGKVQDQTESMYPIYTRDWQIGQNENQEQGEVLEEKDDISLRSIMVSDALMHRKNKKQ